MTIDTKDVLRAKLAELYLNDGTLSENDVASLRQNASPSVENLDEILRFIAKDVVQDSGIFDAGDVNTLKRFGFDLSEANRAWLAKFSSDVSGPMASLLQTDDEQVKLIQNTVRIANSLETASETLLKELISNVIAGDVASPVFRASVEGLANLHTSQNGAYGQTALANYAFEHPWPEVRTMVLHILAQNPSYGQGVPETCLTRVLENPNNGPVTRFYGALIALHSKQALTKAVQFLADFALGKAFTASRIHFEINHTASEKIALQKSALKELCTFAPENILQNVMPQISDLMDNANFTESVLKLAQKAFNTNFMNECSRLLFDAQTPEDIKTKIAKGLAEIDPKYLTTEQRANLDQVLNVGLKSTYIQTKLASIEGLVKIAQTTQQSLSKDLQNEINNLFYPNIVLESDVPHILKTAKAIFQSAPNLKLWILDGLENLLYETIQNSKLSHKILDTLSTVGRTHIKTHQIMINFAFTTTDKTLFDKACAFINQAGPKTKQRLGDQMLALTEQLQNNQLPWQQTRGSAQS